MIFKASTNNQYTQNETKVLNWRDSGTVISDRYSYWIMMRPLTTLANFQYPRSNTYFSAIL